MAAVTLAGGDYPISKKVAGVGTTLQLFNLPPRTRRVRVYGSGAVFVQFTGSDGDAVGADAIAVPATSDRDYPVNAIATKAPKVLVAAQAGTADVTVIAFAE